MSLSPHVLHPPTARGALSGGLIVLWHGAGGDIDQPHLLAVASAAAAHGAAVARARFPYRRSGKKMPDRMPKLVADARETVAAVVTQLGRAPKWLALGGRSMGGRVASMLAAEGDHVDALLFLSYPLHSAAKPDVLRDQHLYEVRAPMLFVQGDRDELCEPARLAPVLARLGARAELASLAGADHSMKKVSNEVIADRVLVFLRERLSSARGSAP